MAAKPMARMPAALAAAMPVGVSSITVVCRGATPRLRAACRNRSGAGLGCSTSSAVKMRPAKRGSSPVWPSVKSTFARLPLEATQ